MNLSGTIRLAIVLLVCAVLGYLLLTLPGQLVEQYERAAGYGAIWGDLYLGVVGLGLALMVGAAGWVGWVVWRNTRRTKAKRERGRRPIRGMSERERRAALGEQVAEARRIAEDAEPSPEVRAAIERDIGEMETRLAEQTLRIVAFGTISSGKSSVLNALAGREVFETDVKGGTTVRTREIDWPNRDRVQLVDTPGLGEVAGGERGRFARREAQHADLIVFVIDGPLKDFEYRTLTALHEMEKRFVVCLNKGDWYAAEDREALLSQVRAQLTGVVEDAADLVAVRAKPGERVRTRVRADGTEREEAVEQPADIAPLAERMMRVLRREGRDLLLANLLLRSRGLVSDARRQVRAMLDERAARIVDRYTWRAAGVAAINPVPVIDVMGGLAFSTRMVLELAKIYRQPVDLETAKRLVSELLRNLSATMGAAAVTPAVSSMIASTLKAVPGVGTVTGGLLQGVTQALVMKWIGRVMIVYFRNQMTAPSGSLSEEAGRQWRQLTSRSELINLTTTGLRELRGRDRRGGRNADRSETKTG